MLDTKTNIGLRADLKKKKWGSSLQSNMEQTQSWACGQCQIDVFCIT